MWVEWCKAQECAARYEEEIVLVVEEMRRTLAYFKWLTREWESRAVAPPVDGPGIDDMIRKGISAYAYRQARIYRKMKDVFINSWYECLQEKDLGSPWLKRYSPPSQTKCHCLVSLAKRYHSASASPEDLPDDAELEQDVGDDHNDPEEQVFHDDDLYNKLMNN